VTQDEARKELVAAGRRLLAGGLVARSWGNLSLRLDDRSMAVTPSGIPYPDLREEMIVVVDLVTDAWEGPWKPSGERKVHREIYRRRPDVKAVVHTHQNAASAWAASRLPVPTATGLVKCAPYALPGTKTLTQGTVDALGLGSAVLMANHGVFAVGADLDQAFTRIAGLEKDCAVQLASRALRGLPAKADTPWDGAWLSPVTLADGTPAQVSTAPFTVAWAARRLPLPALLDDLAQLVGPRVRSADQLPARRPSADAVLVAGTGAVVCGADAEALAMVIEKAARAAIACEGLGGARPFPAWEARLMRWVYKNSYAKQAARARKP